MKRRIHNNRILNVVLSYLLTLAIFISGLSIISYAANDAEFEKHMTSQGFPDSYKPYLRTLHASYPNWIFKAQKINLEWSTVLSNECSSGRNLVHKSNIDSWKSCERGDFDPDKGTWTIYDTSGWVGASKELISYYLDPRNGLNDPGIFQFQSLSYSSSEKVDNVKNILNGTFMSGSYTCPDTKKTYTYANTIMEAAKTAGVSAYHLASRLRQEQGTKGNALALGTVSGYENYFNFYNINASGTGTSYLTNGAKYAATTNAKYDLPWTNQYKAIIGGAKWIANGYINKGQDTIYLQKFDVTDGGNGYYWHQYMTNIQAAASEASSLKKAYTDTMLNSDLVFNIPVYNNMPSSACAKPTSSGNNNNWLGSLSVSGYNITPSFDVYTTSYELVVDNNVSSVTINAKAKDSKASVSGTGKKNLSTGDNKFNIVVTAPSGVKRTYNLSISRKSGGSTPNPTIVSSKYKIASPITGVQPGTSVSSFLSNISVSNGTPQVVSSAKTTKASGNIFTGDILQIYKGSSLYSSYNIVIYGDVNGDGKLTSLDLLKISKHILSISTLSGVYLTAADTNKDGKTSSLDLLRLQKHILGLTTISQ